MARRGPGGRWSSFRVAGLAGLAAALGWCQLLAYWRGLSVPVVPVLGAAGVAAFLGQVVLRDGVAGAPRLVCFRDQAAALAAAAVALMVLGQPVLPYLDIFALGVGLFLAGGRVGCLFAGCCHGRPARWGIRYGPAHVAEGFPAGYSGVRLLPVQLVEALAMTGVVAAGSALVLTGARDGTALVWFGLAQVSARFWLEFLRGDDRPAASGLSEAQWTAVAVVPGLGALVGAGWTGLPRWLALLPLATVAAGVAVAARLAIRGGR